MYRIPEYFEPTGNQRPGAPGRTFDQRVYGPTRRAGVRLRRGGSAGWVAGQRGAAGQQAAAELLGLGPAEVAEHLGLQIVDHGAVAVKQIAARLSQGEHHATPVGGVAVPLDQPVLLER